MNWKKDLRDHLERITFLHEVVNILFSVLLVGFWLICWLHQSYTEVFGLVRLQFGEHPLDQLVLVRT